ncbi:MAG TPA: type II toxin-antitoxin system HicB family antitoxin [Verrucomicrobiota bacterium]|nr:type II toxin-antitoxin system HicB family antitoxin [Verrucomicrobiota bacterium]
MKYSIVIEEGAESLGAYVPDLPGCVAVGATGAEASALIREAIAGHLELMREEELPILKPRSSAELIEVS